MKNKILYNCPEIEFIKDMDRTKIDVYPIIKVEKGKIVTKYVAIRTHGEPGVHLVVIEETAGKDGKVERKETEKYFPEERLITCMSDGKPIYGITGEGGVTWRSQHYKMLKL